jgi:N utilization substance protein B
MSRRTKAREAVLQILYQLDLNPDVPSLTIMDQLRERLKDESLEQFAWKLFTGVVEFRPQLDARIQEIAANWSLRRMAPTDRNVLRLGAFEILHGDTPPRVAVDEAVELAKRYGSAQSAQFVNGILDRLMPDGRGSREAIPIPEPPPEQP